MHPKAIARRTNAATARGVAIDSGITIYNILSIVLTLTENVLFYYIFSWKSGLISSKPSTSALRLLTLMMSLAHAPMYL